MKTRTALAVATIAAMLAASGVGWGYSDPSSPTLGPLTSILNPNALVLGHVKNNAALANLPVRLGRVRRDGFATPGDGGAADYTLGPCPAGSAVDGGALIALNGGGCAVIDWASVNNAASPCLFEDCQTATNDSPAMQSAANTGRTLDLRGKSYWYILSDINFATNGQHVRGRGRYQTVVQMNAPGGFTNGGFVAATPGQAPVFEDFTIQALQPNTSPTSRSQLTTYPPLIYARGVPDVVFQHLNLNNGTTCIDARGNAGQDVFDDVEAACYQYGIALDGAQDTVRINRYHWFPYYMSQAQQALFFDTGGSGPIGIISGRVDGLMIADSLFIGGHAITLYQGTGQYASNVGTDTPANETGPTFGAWRGLDFDNFGGLAMSAGTITCSSCVFTIGNPSAQAVFMAGASHLNLAEPFFIPGVANAAFIQQNGVGSSLNISGGYTTNLYNNDVTVVLAQAGTTSIVGHTFDYVPGGTTAFKNPIINVIGTGAANGATIMSNRITYSSASTPPVFIAVNSADSSYNKVIGNSSPGWSNAFPTTISTGTYSLN